jgi:hypothetical protein
MSTNPKSGLDPVAPSNTAKAPDDWTTGEESMTGAQASYLKTLCEEAGEAFDSTLTRAEAFKRIDAVQAKTGRGRTHLGGPAIDNDDADVPARAAASYEGAVSASPLVWTNASYHATSFGWPDCHSSDAKRKSR